MKSLFDKVAELSAERFEKLKAAVTAAAAVLTTFIIVVLHQQL